MENDELILEKVFATGNPALVALAKSILEGADIPYLVKNETTQGLFGGGALGTGYNPIVGPIELHVRADDAEQARRLLADLDEG